MYVSFSVVKVTNYSIALVSKVFLNLLSTFIIFGSSLPNHQFKTVDLLLIIGLALW